MCLITFAYKVHPKYPVILAANRDEFYERPTALAHWWEESNQALGGKDLQAGGTWMGLHLNQRFAALTNIREPHLFKKEAPSRGHLVRDFILSDQSPESYLATLDQQAQAFNGFNLLLAQGESWYYYSNRQPEIQALRPGIYGLSNDLLDTPWPKVKKAKSLMESVAGQAEPHPTSLLEGLYDKETAPDTELPETGVPLDWERKLSAMHIQTPHYGTRATTVLMIDHQGNGTFLEKSFLPAGFQTFTFSW